LNKFFFYFAATCLAIVLSGCAVFSVVRVSDTVRNPGYEVNPWNTVKIKNQDIIIYVKPCNDLFIGSGTQFIPLLPVDTSYKETKEHFYDDNYYDKYYSGNHGFVSTPPPFFYIEILFDPKEDGFSFDPKNASLMVTGKPISASAYIAPEGFFRGPAVEVTTLLSPYETIKDYLDTEHTTPQSFPLHAKEKRGFAIKFDVSPPKPGSNFAIKIEGLRDHNQPFELPLIEYSGVKQVKEYRYS